MYSKRKRHTDHPREPNYDPRRVQEDYERTQADHARALAKFQLQAYEADVVTGPVAKGRARMLEYVEGVGPGKGLIACAPGDEEGSGSGAQSDAGWGGFDGGEDVISLGSSAVTSKSSTAPNRVTGESGVGKTVWVDRYDARLLLDSFASRSLGHDGRHASSRSTEALDEDSDSGWSDLPDVEEVAETFLLSPDEALELHRQKRRKLMDEAWERRIREREEEDAEDEASEAAAAAALLDEEPIPEMLTLMQRTASHLASASNPAQLEMRILANHGNDERFSFMREGGRSRNVWLRIKAEAVEKVKKAKEAEEKEKQKKRGLGMGVLAGYDSEDESGSEGEEAPPPPPPPPEDEAPAPPPPPPPANVPDKEALKAARREKARQWLEERKKSGTNS